MVAGRKEGMENGRVGKGGEFTRVRGGTREGRNEKWYNGMDWRGEWKRV